MSADIDQLLVNHYARLHNFVNRFSLDEVIMLTVHYIDP